MSPLVRCSLRFVVLLNVLVTCLLLAGCAGPVAVPEMRAYGGAFEQMRRASDGILDELATSERELARDVAASAGSQGQPLGVDETFDPNHAVYHSMGGEPPLTRSYRIALRVVGAYNDALLALAEGRTLTELHGDARRLGREVLDTASLVAGATLLPGLGVALPILERLADEAASAASRAAFQEAFLRHYETVDELLLEMRAGTAEIFRVLTRLNLARLRRARLDGAPAAEREAFAVRHEVYRTVLADWVVLIDETRLAMRDVKTALEAPPSLGAEVTDLAERAARLRMLAASVRMGLSRAREDI